MSDLHSHFIYILTGGMITFVFAVIFLRLLDDHPRQRMQVCLAALLGPLSASLLYHTVLTKRCESGILAVGYVGMLHDLACGLGSAALRWFGPLLVVLFSAGLLRIAAAALLIHRLRCGGTVPLPADRERVARILNRRCLTLGIAVPEAIQSVRSGFAAFTVGWPRPVVVINARLAARLSDGELDDLLTHELVHIRRGDTLTGWLLHLARDVMFFSPFSHVLLRWFLSDNERLCDNETVLVTGEPGRYAATLVKVWRLLLDDREFRPGLGAGFVGNRSDLELRVTSVLGRRPVGRGMPAPVVYGVFAVLFIALVAGLGAVC